MAQTTAVVQNNASMQAILTISPLQALADQLQIISANALQSQASYTLVSRLTLGTTVYEAFAHYAANDEGKIDVSNMPSLGGSFVGVEPMGLITFMQPITPKASSEANRNALMFRLLFHKTWLVDFFLLPDRVTPVTNEKGSEQISIDGHLAQATATRLVVHPRVTRTKVTEGQLRGVLFVPHGSGPFLGVLDIYGGVQGKLYERRAALLAAHGYVTFALGFIEYEGTPDVNNTQLEYFLEAAHLLEHHPRVSKGGLAVLSNCLGSHMALLLAAHSSKVKAVVTYNAPTYRFSGKVTLGDQIVTSSLHGDLLTAEERLVVSAAITRHTFPVLDDHVFPVDSLPRDADMLLLAGDDDDYMGCDHTFTLARRMQQAGKRNVEVIVYEGQGHFSSEPYIPTIKGGLRRSDGRVLSFGGKHVLQEKAIEKSWRDILSFFDQQRLRFNLKTEQSHL